MKLNLGENRAIKASDRIDAEHYSASTYADVLVTDDRAFTETCEMIPDRPFRIETFDEFVGRLATPRATPS